MSTAGALIKPIGEFIGFSTKDDVKKAKAGSDATNKAARDKMMADIAKQDEERDKKAAQLATLQQRTSYGSNERNLSRSFLLRL